MASVNFTGFVFKHDVRNYSRVNRCRQMRTEADANVERCVEMERDRWAELVHRLTLQADEDRERVAAFFNSYAPGMDTREQAGETIFEILHHRAGIGAEGEMDHAGAVLAHHHLFGIVVEALAKDEYCLAVAEALGGVRRPWTVPDESGRIPLHRGEPDLQEAEAA